MGDLTTLANVKDFLEVDANDVTADLLLTRLITVCSSQFERETMRTFTQQQFVDTLTMGPGSVPTPRWIPQNVPIFTPIFGYPMSGYRTKLNLLQYPWISSATTTVVLDGTAITQQDPSDPGSDGWFVAEESSGVLGLAGWYQINPGVSKVVVTYTAGYTPVPLDIEQAVIEWVSWKFGHERQRQGQLAASMNGESVSFSQFDKPMSVANVIDLYRRKTIA